MTVKRPTVTLTMGDPAGIGPEIVVKCVTDREVTARMNVVIYGDASILRQTAASMGAGLRFSVVSSLPARPSRRKRAVQVVEPHRGIDLVGIRPGRSGRACGAASVRFLVAAAEAVLQGRADALVTAPVCKASMWAAGHRYEGQTQLLARLCRVRRIGMVLVQGPLRVMLLSRHLPLRDAISKVNKRNVLQMIRLAHRALVEVGVDAPRIAVAGLNPHAGEGDLFGMEERREIAPAVRQAAAEGVNVSGPFPADTVFGLGLAGHADMILALYHDQGMIPVKTLGIQDLVVWIAGLPIIRTSVGHGTAFDIAGTRTADPRSLKKALCAAASMAQGPGWALRRR